MTIQELKALHHLKAVQIELTNSPYKYFHKWKYDEEVFNDLSWVGVESINTRRESILEHKARDYANFSFYGISSIFAIYIVFYLLNLARKWLYKK